MNWFQGMQYNTLHFLIFIGIFFLVYFAMPKNFMKVAVIILSNIFFYYSLAGVQPLLIVLITFLIVYLFSMIITEIYANAEIDKPKDLSLKGELEYWKPIKNKTKRILVLGVILILSILIYIKIGKLLQWENVNSVFELSFGKIIVPLGLSYYTFSSIGYLIDIYKRKIEATRNAFYLFACITFFPIIVEGPISRYDKLLVQFKAIPKFDYDRLCMGMQLFLWGLLKKIVIADRVSAYSNTIFGELDYHAGVEIVLALFFNMISMYTDFSGCMDMVTGISEAMGIKLEQNFKQPFLAQSVPDFWRRWHMTLCAWFRDYVYMPMAKSSWAKKLNTKVRNRFNKHISESLTMSIPMFTVWLLTGLWHGTGKAYIVWGIYWGLLMFASMLLNPYIENMNIKLNFKTDTFGWKFFRAVRTDILYCIASAIATVGSVHGLKQVVNLFYRVVVEHRLWRLFNGDIFMQGMTSGDFSVVVFGLGVLTFVDVCNDKGISIREKMSHQPLVFRWLVWIGLIVFIMVWGKYGNGYDASAFIYKDF